MHICFVVEGYPAPGDPLMTFIRNTVAGIARLGVKCTVLCPQSVTRALFHRMQLRPKRWRDELGNGISIDVIQPYYFSLSGNAGSINQASFIQASMRGYRLIEDAPDVLYAHFWHMGVVASLVDSEKPLYVACGESRISVCERFSLSELSAMRRQLCGVIYVSSKSREESVSLGLQGKASSIVLPNGIDESIFYQRDRASMRRELGWQDDLFVVSYVGTFNERKGSSRVSEALAQINRDDTVCSCFIGSGDSVPTCSGILYCGRLANNNVPLYLCASDIFVLPTLNEGCCNAIVEALACGLPVVSSNASFNDDILDDGNSIRINPLNVDEIARTILRLRNDDALRQSLSAGAIKSAKELRVGTRCAKIIKFMDGTHVS